MKTLAIATMLTLAPALAFAMGCNKNHDTVASCPAGQTWDSDKGACTDAATS